MCQNPGFGYNQASEVRIELIYFLFFSVLPRPEFLFSCTKLGHWPNACDKQNFRVLEFLLEREGRNIQVLANSELSCPQLSAGEMEFETTTPRTGRDRGCRGAKTIHLPFGFLRASVPLWCKVFFFRLARNSPKFLSTIKIRDKSRPLPSRN